MKNISNKATSVLAGGLAGFNGYLGLSNLLRYANERTAIIQKLLNEQPVVTKEVYKLVSETSHEILGLSNHYLGLLELAFAGVCAGTAIYYGSKKD